MGPTGVFLLNKETNKANDAVIGLLTPVGNDFGVKPSAIE